MNDYLVTSITGLFCSFGNQLKLKIIKVEEDSLVSSIYGHVFSYSKIDEIYFPKKFERIERRMVSLYKKFEENYNFTINEQFIFKDDKYLLWKSDINKDEFDTLLIIRHDIEEIAIPSNLSKISEYAFSYCSNLRKVEIPTNSR